MKESLLLCTADTCFKICTIPLGVNIEHLKGQFHEIKEWFLGSTDRKQL